MGAMASQITSLTIVYSSIYPCADQRTHQSSAPLAFVRGIHRWPVNSPHKRPVTGKMFPLDDVIMYIFRRRHWSHRSTWETWTAGTAGYVYITMKDSLSIEKQLLPHHWRLRVWESMPRGRLSVSNNTACPIIKPATFDDKTLISLLNLAGGSAAVLPNRLPNFRAIEKILNSDLAPSRLGEILW